jgi:hypothetical protein
MRFQNLDKKNKDDYKALKKKNVLTFQTCDPYYYTQNTQSEKIMSPIPNQSNNK